MYLRQVLKYNPRLFWLLLAFAAAQVFINVKRGMVVSPFFHYGMYSEAMPVAAAYPTFEIAVNDSMLQGSDFMPWQWDKIIWPVLYFSQVNKSNQLYLSDAKRIMQRLHLHPKDEHFLTTCNYQQFANWYKNYLGTILAKPVKTIAVNQRNYTYINQQLVPGIAATPLQNLCR